VGSTNQLAPRHLFTMTMKVQLTDARTSGVVVHDADVPSVRDVHARRHSARGAAFIDQERSSFDRIASDVARTVVTAILEAF
jgi:hypothetical protein